MIPKKTAKENNNKNDEYSQLEKFTWAPKRTRREKKTYESNLFTLNSIDKI